MSASLLCHGIDDATGLDKNVKLFLDGLQLEQYYENFRKHSVDSELFFTLTNEDLKNLDINDEDHRKTLLRATTKRPTGSDEPSRSLTREEADAVLSNTYKYLNVLKLYLKEIDPNRAKHEIRNLTVDFEYPASTGIVTASTAAIKCVEDLREQHTALLLNDLPKKLRKTKSFLNIPVLTVLLAGILISTYIVRR